MANTPHQPSREERLAAKLRENLRRRKAQSRAIEAEPHPPEENTAGPADESPSPALPKDGSES